MSWFQAYPACPALILTPGLVKSLHRSPQHLSLKSHWKDHLHGIIISNKTGTYQCTRDRADFLWYWHRNLVEWQWGCCTRKVPPVGKGFAGRHLDHPGPSVKYAIEQHVKWEQVEDVFNKSNKNFFLNICYTVLLFMPSRQVGLLSNIPKLRKVGWSWVRINGKTLGWVMLILKSTRLNYCRG